VVTKVAATVLCVYGFGLVTPISWLEIALIWTYSITWSFVTDWAKIAVYKSFEKSSHRHRNFLSTLGKQLHPTAANPVRPPRHMK
jgi:H+-transporting ATPase